jgi:hypothetical protein
MITSTLLLYATKTGHVMAAVTVVAPPSGDVKAESLAGKLLPVRYVGNPNPVLFATTHATIPADHLTVLPVGSKAAPIGQTAIVLVNQDKSLAPLDITHTLTAALAATRDALNIAFAIQPTGKTALWVRIEWAGAGVPPDPPSAAQTVEMELTPPIVGAVHVPLQTLAPGLYSALVLARGFVPLLTTI